MVMENSNKHDVLGELFRRKLEGHQLLVDVSDWDNIEHRLRNQNRNKNKAVLWWSTSAALAAAACFAAVMFFMPTGLVTDKMEHLVPTSEVASTSESAVAPKRVTTSELVAMPEPVTTPKLVVAPESVTPSELVATSESITSSELVATSESVTSSELVATSESVATSELVIISEQEIPFLDTLLIANFDIPKTQTQHKWLFAAAFGVGGNATSGSDFSKSSNQEFGLSGDNNRYAVDLFGGVHPFSYMHRDQFSNISHSPPFSSGITARRMLGNHVGVESGLIYTFLSSRFEWAGWGDWVNYHAYQKLHYLGIPVNFTIYFGDSKSKNWQFYLLGGFMLEKGLRAIYTQEEKTISQIRTITVRSSIDGVQWSLNGGFGVSYKLEKNWNIHFEPRLGYSFDNKQPVSIRTEHPLYFGVNLGLNYKF